MKNIKNILAATPLLLSLAQPICLVSCGKKPIEDINIVCNNKTKRCFGSASFVLETNIDNLTLDQISMHIQADDISVFQSIDYQIIDKNIIVNIKLNSKAESNKSYPFALVIKYLNHSDILVEGFNVDYLIVDEEIKQHDQDAWQHAIEYMSECKHPTFFCSSDASFAMQQLVNLYISSSQLALQKNIYSSDEYKYNDFIYMPLGTVWDNKEKKITGQNYALSCNYFTDSRFGYTDILANSIAMAKSTVDLDLGHNMIISNYQDFDLSLSAYNKERDDYLEWHNHNYHSIVMILNKLLDLYEEKNPNMKFNFVWTDVMWDIYFDETRFNLDEFNKLLVRIFRKVDKFYIISDGSYTWVTGNQKFMNFYQENGYLSAEEQAEAWNKLMSFDTDDDAFEYFKQTNPMIWYNNEKYFHFFAPCVNSTYSDCFLDVDRCLTKETTRKYAYPWISTKKYGNVLDSTRYLNYKDCYTSLYHFNDVDKTQKFADYVVYDTYKNFDTNKKNLIFLLPGAFRSENPDGFWSSCRKVFDKIKTNYPTEKWNYIYKFHPRTTQEQVLNCLLKLFNVSQESEIPDNSVVLDQTYPFEYMVCLDQYMVSNNYETHYHLIDPTTITSTEPNGILTGFDLSTTSFYAIFSMFVNEYGFSWNEVLKLLPKNVFFIPRDFAIPSYQYETGKDYSEQNLHTIKEFYKSMYPIHEFINPDEFEIV